jgi:hypothetical protein
MSEIAILRGTEQHLRNVLDEWNTTNCQARPTGNPVAMSGDAFCAIHMREHQVYASDNNLEDLWGFTCTVTKRIRTNPDKILTDSVYLNTASGLAYYLDRIITVLHNRWDFINVLTSNLDDSLLPTGYTNGQSFATPCKLVYRDTLKYRDEDWFMGSDSEARDDLSGHIAMSASLEFGNIRRIVRYIDCP